MARAAPDDVSEAQNCGVPVIASAVGGIPEQVLDGQTGWLVPAADKRASTNRLAELLASGDRARRWVRPGGGMGDGSPPRTGSALFEQALLTTLRRAVE